jgi:hypothetical protein
MIDVIHCTGCTGPRAKCLCNPYNSVIFEGLDGLHGQESKIIRAETKKNVSKQGCTTARQISHTLVGVNRPGTCRTTSPRQVVVAREGGGDEQGS